MDRRAFLKVLVGGVSLSLLPDSHVFAAEFSKEVDIAHFPEKMCALDRVNTRRVAKTISEQVKELYLNYVDRNPGTFNDHITRLQLTGEISGLMNGFREKRLINEYKVICDDSNNPPSVIDADDLALNVYYTTTRAAGSHFEIRCRLYEDAA